MKTKKKQQEILPEVQIQGNLKDVRRLIKGVNRKKAIVIFRDAEHGLFFVEYDGKIVELNGKDLASLHRKHTLIYFDFFPGKSKTALISDDTPEKKEKKKKDKPAVKKTKKEKKEKKEKSDKKVKAENQEKPEKKGKSDKKAKAEKKGKHDKKEKSEKKDKREKPAEKVKPMEVEKTSPATMTEREEAPSAIQPAE